MTSSQIIEVVASGTLETIKHWEELLRKARIPFEVRRLIDEHRPTRRNYAELWVDKDQMGRARLIIRSDPLADSSMLW